MMQYNEALAKMNQLKNCTPETIQLLVNIYNQSMQEPNKTTNSLGNPQQTTTNTFGNSSNVFGQSQPQQSSQMSVGSIFGGQQLSTNSMNTGSIFGSTQPSNPFVQTTNQSSIFGGAKPQQNETSNSAFSFSINQNAQQQQQPQQSSIFGSSQPSSNIFGAPATFNQPSTNIFSLNQQPQQQPAPASSFSFAGSSIFGQQQVQQTQHPNPQPFSAFSNPTGNTNSVFGQQQQPQTTPGSMFNIDQTQQLPTTTIGQPPTGLFASVFSQSNTQQVQPPQPSNIFAQAQQPAPASSIFGQNQLPVQQQQQPGSSIFQIDQNITASNFANPFAAASQPILPPRIDENAFTEIEKLSPEEIQAFEAEEFILGKIPLNPPARQFCV